MNDEQDKMIVPDDASSLTRANMWTTTVRLELKDGTTLFHEGASFPYEPHQGDLHSKCGHLILQMLGAASETNVLKFLPSDGGPFFTPLANVQGIYLDLIDPDGEEVSSQDIKPGYHGIAN